MPRFADHVGPAWNSRPRFKGWLVLGVLTAAILVTFALLAWRDLQNRYEVAARQGHDTTWFIGRNLSQKLHQYDVQLATIIGEIEIGGIASATDEAVWRVMTLAIASTPFVRSIGVYDASGHVVQHSEHRGGYPEVSVADREYFRRLQANPGQGAVITTPIASRVHGDTVIGIARAIRGSGGGFGGVALVAVLPEAFDLMGGLSNMPGGSAISVHRMDGVNLFRAPPMPEQVGRDMSDTPLFSEAIPAAPLGVTRTPRQGSPMDGEERLLAYRVLDDWPLVVVAGIRGAAIIGEWRRDWSRNALLVGLALVGFCWLAVIAQRQTTERLQTELHLSRRELQYRIAMEEELRRLATTDCLTGLANRRHFMEQCEREVQRSLRHARPLSVLMFDVDLFKRINDRFGHAAGDCVLRALAEATAMALRETDLLGRLGGEEFAVLLPETDMAGAADLAERLRAAVTRISLDLAGEPVALSVSVGVATLKPDEPSTDSLLARADLALYQAKEAGRNRVAVA